LIVFSVEIGVFALIYRQFPQIYEPRTFLPKSKRERVSPLPKSILGWAFEIWHADSRQILDNNGLDAYMFFRYMKMMLAIFIPQWIVTWVLMLPVYGTAHGGKTGLYRFTFGSKPDFFLTVRWSTRMQMSALRLKYATFCL
jgi:hypothetical protein